MNTVFVSGQGLVCAAGSDRRTSAHNLLAGISHIDMRTVVAGPRPYATITGDHGAWLDRLVNLVTCALHEALDEAGLSLDDARRSPLFLGSSALYAVFGENSVLLHTGRSLNAVCVALRERLHWAAPIALYTTACSSALVALSNACAAVRSGRFPQALAVGIELDNFTSLNGFSAMGLLSPTASRPFCARRDGLLLGEGVAVTVVGRQGRWQIAALELGLDPCSPTGVDPSGRPQLQLWQRTLRRAGWQWTDIDLFKAHAAGSPSNDLAEAAALHLLEQPLPPLVSLKSLLGHTLGASGLVELAALTACLETGHVPATAGFVEPDPAVNLAPTTVTTAAHPRRLLCHWIGFGGSLAAMALEDTAACSH